ncbi:response regulator [Thiothrix fructosivorans]|jgi:two-component system copper resistance phosphate regulon response regulator CusR|uniref:Response regulator transcription factor n=1 Tax=Thiothrix fructosivorans TaxID=111770 RepID=A0A8B0SC26_9GAMM|nr:response regulator transcription factor [Thiothrix fructosivorans]MBO0614670.1 response regulator transcription factor [Thiothrix fructosivorans]QTX09493.1 response regulator transcription factor [Thiothrix fructosivorans]
MRILLAEDHTELREAIARRLRALGNSVDEVSSIREIRTYLNGAHYDVGVFDRMLPDGDSLTLLQALRNAANRTPILLLTARDRIEDRVEGLQVGADDYLVKPFAMDELMARINVLARRGEPLRDTILRIADLEVDSGRHEVRRAGVLIPLRPKEYAVLELLAVRNRRAVSRNDILEYCWDTLESPASNVEETIIASLRRKLGEPALIKTVRGHGYKLDDAHES